jgi:uncharacterized membrane protein YkgB
MLITTPGSTISVHGIRYMSFLGLFLYKDVISLGVSFYLISYFGNKAILLENRGELNEGEDKVAHFNPVWWR